MLHALLQVKRRSIARIKRLSSIWLHKVASYVGESPSTRDARLLFDRVQLRGFGYIYANKYSHDFYTKHIPWKPAYQNVATIIYESAEPSSM